MAAAPDNKEGLIEIKTKDGTPIQVAKKGLPEKFLNALLPPSVATAVTDPAIQASVKDGLQNAAATLLPMSVARVPEAQPVVPGQVPPVAGGPAPASVPEQDMGIPFQPQAQAAAPTDPMKPIYEAQKGLLGQEQQVNREAMAQSQKAFSAFEQQAAKQEQDFQSNVAKLDQDREALIKGIGNGDIDPNRYWANKSTGGKVATIIGMLASGFGSGLAKQENAAIALFRKSIEDDVNAQIASMNTKRGLLSDNMNQRQNVAAEYHRALDQKLTIAKTQVDAALARATSQGQIIRLEMAKKALDGEIVKNSQQYGLAQVQAASSMGGVPTKLIPAALRNNKEFAEKSVEIGPMSYTARTAEEGVKLRETEAAGATLRDRIGELQSLGMAAIPASEKKARAETIINFLTPILAKGAGLGVLSDKDIAMLKSQMGNPTGLISFVTSNARGKQLLSNVEANLEAKRAATLWGYTPQKPANASKGFVK